MHPRIVCGSWRLNVPFQVINQAMIVQVMLQWIMIYIYMSVDIDIYHSPEHESYLILFFSPISKMVSYT